MLPYSPLQITDDGLYFVSGQLPADMSAPAGEQAASCLDAIDRVLAERGISKDTILKTTLFTTELGSLPEINEAYLSHFDHGHMPARSAFEVTALAKGAKVEIDCYGKVAC